jgi:hypothetical protein
LLQLSLDIVKVDTQPERIIVMSNGSSSQHVPHWAPVHFETATVTPGQTAGSYTLTVTGETPSSGETNLGVRLAAHEKYLVQPEYWAIAVEWDRAGAIFQSTMPYRESIPLDHIRGTKGIEVVGNGMSKKIDIP